MTQRSKRIYLVVLLFSCALICTTLVILALKENINLFFTPTQLLTQTEKFLKKTHLKIRIGGMVKKGSVQREPNLLIKFVITDFQNNLAIEYRGILPDLFREGQGVVVQGHLIKPDLFIADEVLAKHDENYMPRSALKIETKSIQ